MMPKMIKLGRGGGVAVDRVVAVAPFRSKPIKRLLDAAGSGKVVNLTYGYPRLSVILLDNGYLLVTKLTTDEVMRAFELIREEGMSHEAQP
jgi:regulator of extracellular matrix RemA (YlzA/DUF370 family)